MGCQHCSHGQRLTQLCHTQLMRIAYVTIGWWTEYWFAFPHSNHLPLTFRLWRGAANPHQLWQQQQQGQRTPMTFQQEQQQVFWSSNRVSTTEKPSAKCAFVLPSQLTHLYEWVCLKLPSEWVQKDIRWQISVMTIWHLFISHTEVSKFLNSIDFKSESSLMKWQEISGGNVEHSRLYCGSWSIPSMGHYIIWTCAEKILSNFHMC